MVILSIRLVIHIRDLGIIIDNKLSFDEHISNLTHKANQKIGILRNAFFSKDHNFHIQLFKTFIIPLIDYCSPAIMYSTKKQIKNLESIQRKFCLYTLNLYDIPYADRLRYINLPSIETRILCSDIFAVRNFFKGSLYLNINPFTPNQSNTRSTLFKHRCNTTLFSRFWSNRVINLYERIPHETTPNRRTLINFLESIDCSFFN